MAEISAKFLDLGFDEGHDSEQYEEMRVKQDKFRKEFEKFNFTFDTMNLDMPSASTKNEDDLFNMADETFEQQKEALGTDLADLFSTIGQKQREYYKLEGSVSEFS